MAREAFLKLSKERNQPELLQGVYNPWVEWRSAHDVCGEDVWMDVCDAVINDEVFLEQPPFPGAVETLNELSEKGHQIMYLSSRRTHLDSVTREWINRNNFPEGAIICTEGDKIPFMREADYLIDDRPRWLVGFVYDRMVKRQRKAFGLLYSYNRALTDIQHIYLAPTWAGLRYYLIEKDVIRG